MLALALGRTVRELQAVMTAPEFDTWKAFYAAHPFDDFHRYHRPAALISASFGGDYDAKLDVLRSHETPKQINSPQKLRLVEVIR